MPVKVVDASALGALVFGEPEADTVAAEISDDTLVAPSLIWYELASICLKKIRKSPDEKSNLLKAFQLAQLLPIETAAVNHLDVIRLAEKKRITTYDAGYLWISRKLKAELVTLDRKLLNAAKR
jgi:predicted nucleic acid-binding protein